MRGAARRGDYRFDSARARGGGDFDGFRGRPVRACDVALVRDAELFEGRGAVAHRVPVADASQYYAHKRFVFHAKQCFKNRRATQAENQRAALCAGEFPPKKGGREKPVRRNFLPRDTVRLRELSRKRTPQRQRRIYASNSSRTFFADSGMTVPGPKMALAPLSSRNL